jgi:hypothetical protein
MSEDPIELRMEDVSAVSILGEPENITFKPPFTLEQIRELEQVWVNAPRGRRLEAVGVKAAELGVEIKSMRREPPSDARIKFWDCPEDHPRQPQRVRIVWDGDVATCQDCGRTNRD